MSGGRTIFKDAGIHRKKRLVLGVKIGRAGEITVGEDGRALLTQTQGTPYRKGDIVQVDGGFGGADRKMAGCGLPPRLTVDIDRVNRGRVAENVDTAPRDARKGDRPVNDEIAVAGVGHKRPGACAGLKGELHVGEIGKGMGGVDRDRATADAVQMDLAQDIEEFGGGKGLDGDVVERQRARGCHREAARNDRERVGDLGAIKGVIELERSAGGGIQRGLGDRIRRVDRLPEGVGVLAGDFDQFVDGEVFGEHLAREGLLYKTASKEKSKFQICIN